MVLDYIEANIDTIDRNGDGIIGMFWQSVISDTTTPLHVQEVFVKHLVQVLTKMEISTVSR